MKKYLQENINCLVTSNGTNGNQTEPAVQNEPERELEFTLWKRTELVNEKNYKNSSGDEIANVNFCTATTYM